MEIPPGDENLNSSPAWLRAEFKDTSFFLFFFSFFLFRLLKVFQGILVKRLLFYFIIFLKRVLRCLEQMPPDCDLLEFECFWNDCGHCRSWRRRSKRTPKSWPTTRTWTPRWNWRTRRSPRLGVGVHQWKPARPVISGIVGGSTEAILLFSQWIGDLHTRLEGLLL